jgi:hypothetical protein
MSRQTSFDETRIAQRILSVLPDGAVTRLVTSDGETIRFAVTDPTLKLRTVVFSRRSLQQLACDGAADIKIEYLQRDILRSAGRRAEFRYPRENRIVTAIRGRRVRKFARLAVATL